MLGDGAIGREEALSVARGLEALHVAFALSGGLVRILRTVVQIPVLAMFHTWKDLSLRGCVALEFVGHDHAGYVG